MNQQTGTNLTDGVTGLARGVVDGVKDTGVNATEAADEIGSEAGSLVRKALLNAAAVILLIHINN